MFRQTVGQFATGVAVVTTQIDGTIRALTVNSFTGLSLDPPMVLFCVGKATKTGQIIDAVTGFVVNILRQEQHDLSWVDDRDVVDLRASSVPSGERVSHLSGWRSG